MVEIRLVKSAEIFGAPNAEQLIEEYGRECLVPIDPQVELYARMEDAGLLQCVGVYNSQGLVGFASILIALMPHNGVQVGTVESVFVTERARRGMGLALLSAIEGYAKAAGCVTLLYSVRIGSELEFVLGCRKECRRTHTTFTRDLQ